MCCNFVANVGLNQIFLLKKPYFNEKQSKYLDNHTINYEISKIFTHKLPKPGSERKHLVSGEKL